MPEKSLWMASFRPFCVGSRVFAYTITSKESGYCAVIEKLLTAFVRSELKKLGFLLNEQKTRIQHSCQQQTVTGIVVNEKLSIPADDRRRLRQELYYFRKYGISGHLRRIGADVPEEIYRQRLLGKVSYFLQVSPGDPALMASRQWLLGRG